MARDDKAPDDRKTPGRFDRRDVLKGLAGAAALTALAAGQPAPGLVTLTSSTYQPADGAR